MAAARRLGVLPLAIGSALAAGAVTFATLWWRAQHDPVQQPPAPPKQTVVVTPPPAPAAPPVRGVTATEITFGMSAPFSGPAKELGRGMKTGVDLAFTDANEQGGVYGRKLRLVAMDDGYEPDRTRTTMRELLESQGVFGFIGNVGTPTAEVAVPFALDHKMIFFAPFTGATLLRREPPDRYVFNFRASYPEETAATVKYLVEVRRVPPAQIAVFAQQDGYGDAGFNGVAKMIRKYTRGPARILRVGYKRNTVDVGEAVQHIVSAKREVRAVVMVATYKAAARFIEKVKAQRPEMIFTNVSFVGSQALAEELVSLGPKVADGVIVTQVVPLPLSRATAVLRYQSLLAKHSLGEKPDFISLEGYLAGTLLVEALKRAGKDVTTETLVDALEQLRNVDLGVGAPVTYSLSEHQALHKVWGTMLDASGNFQPLEMD
jgi:ABC-type branched-subunit amino acid transport system substrate-binding protein